MNTITFDSHSFVKRLMEAGMQEPVAEVLAEEQTRQFAERLATNNDIVATKHDIEIVRRDIKEMEMRLSRDLKIWVGTVGIALFSALVAIKYFG